MVFKRLNICEIMKITERLMKCHDKSRNCRAKIKRQFDSLFSSWFLYKPYAWYSNETRQAIKHEK